MSISEAERLAQSNFQVSQPLWAFESEQEKNAFQNNIDTITKYDPNLAQQILDNDMLREDSVKPKVSFSGELVDALATEIDKRLDNNETGVGIQEDLINVTGNQGENVQSQSSSSEWSGMEIMLIGFVGLIVIILLLVIII